MLVTCPLLVAACCAVLVKIATLNSVMSSSFVFSSLASPDMQKTSIVTPSLLLIASAIYLAHVVHCGDEKHTKGKLLPLVTTWGHGIVILYVLYYFLFLFYLDLMVCLACRMCIYVFWCLLTFLKCNIGDLYLVWLYWMIYITVQKFGVGKIY